MRSSDRRGKARLESFREIIELMDCPANGQADVHLEGATLGGLHATRTELEGRLPRITRDKRPSVVWKRQTGGADCEDGQQETQTHSENRPETARS